MSSASAQTAAAALRDALALVAGIAQVAHGRPQSNDGYAFPLAWEELVSMPRVNAGQVTLNVYTFAVWVAVPIDDMGTINAASVAAAETQIEQFVNGVPAGIDAPIGPHQGGTLGGQVEYARVQAVSTDDETGYLVLGGQPHRAMRVLVEVRVTGDYGTPNF